MSNDTTAFTVGDYVTSSALPGVALWYTGECDDGQGSVECVTVVMVGDDHTHHVDPWKLMALDDDEFCGGCGQIGCGHA